MLQARLLGRYEIRMDDEPVVISSRPTQSLLAFLLLHPERAHRREKLAGQFWPDATESNARSNLRHALWQIRRALGPDAHLRVESDDLGVTYRPQPGDRLDVGSFEAGSENAGSTDALLLAVSAYEGELLPGFYEDWVVLERERLQAAFERELGKLLDRLLGERRWDEVLKWGEHWVASGTVPEPAYRALMLAHAGLGNLAGASAQYQRCVETLARELGVEPSERTRLAFEQIRDGGVELLRPESVSSAAAAPTVAAVLPLPDRPASVFVGRDAELAALGGYLSKALRGQAQVVFVSGEAGAGKSALLRAFVRRSLTAHPDLVVGWGSCNAFFGRGDPYLPFRDVLNTLAGGLESLHANGIIPQSQVRNLLACFPLVVRALVEQGPDLVDTFLSSSTLAARVAAILPGDYALRERVEKPADWAFPSAREQDKPQLFEQYTQVLHRVADQRPLLIVLDDLQWMDPGSGRLLFHMVRRLQSARILIAGAFRAEEIALGRDGERHPLEPLLNEFKSSYGEISVDLDRARETSGRDFVDSFLETEPNRLDEAFRRQLYRKTLGNPLFIIQLLRNLQERHEIYRDEQGRWVASTHLKWGSLPAQVEGIIGERIGRLDRELQDLLLIASVEGEQFTVQVLERVQGAAELVILQQLSRELEKRHRLVQEMGEITVEGQRLVRFRFVHGLVQQYLYQQLGTSERAALHQEIAETLEILYAGNTALVAVPLARHYREAGVREKAVEYLLQVGDQARSLYALQEATNHYQEALTDLKVTGETEQMARTLMKLYLVYHSSFDFKRAQEALEEYNSLWRRLEERGQTRPLPAARDPFRLPIFKVPALDPALCDDLFDVECIKQLFCGLAEWSEDRNVMPFAARHWEVLDGGRRYVLSLRDDMRWSDGEPVTARDFEFAWKRVLDPATGSLSASLLYCVSGARDYHQGRAVDPGRVGIAALDPYTLVVELEEPCGHFPYILGDPVSFAVPRHVVEREGKVWTEPGRIVTNGAFRLESWDRPSGKTIRFIRNRGYFGKFRGNIERVTLTFHQNDSDVYQSFVAGELDMAEFFLPQLQQDGWHYYREVGQLHTSPVPFVDAIHFVTDRPPFDNPDLRRAFVLATDREVLTREIENQLTATGGYIPPGLPGHSPDIGLPYRPQEAQRIMAAAGYPQGRGFPTVGLLLGLVSLETVDSHVFACLQEMWARNLGVTIQRLQHDPAAGQFEGRQDFNLFFIGWFADFPDPASFLQMNYLIDQSHWQNPVFKRLIEEAQHTLDQGRRVELYRRADRVLMEEAVVLPLFYGHIYQLLQPWVQKPAGLSLYGPPWKDIVLMPH